MTIEDGGPAFPVPETVSEENTMTNTPSDAEDVVNDGPAVVVRAPDQIWLCCGDMYDCRGCDVEFDDIKRSFEVSWCEDQIDESDVKYVRADLYERDIRISKDQWAELVARHPETMQVLFGGQP